MVGRLVEDQQVGFADQHRCQCHTFELAAGKLAYLLVEIIDFQTGQNFLGSLFVVPGSEGVHTAHGLLQPILHRIGDGSLVGGDGSQGRIVGTETGFQYG